MYKTIINNNIYFKSKYNFEIKNENVALSILNSIKSRNNKVLLIDEFSNKVNSYDVVKNIEKVAKGFNQIKLNKNDIVGILLPNSIRFIYFILGSLLCGAIISPVDPNKTENELKTSISTLNPKYIIIDNKNYNRLKSSINELFLSCEYIIVINDDNSNTISTLEISPLNFKNKNLKIIEFTNFINNDGVYNINQTSVDVYSDIAFILFSSGTTGNFKGVSLTHANIHSNINQMKILNILNPDHTTFINVPIFHAFGLNVILLPLLMMGICLIISKSFNLIHFLKTIQNEKPSKVVLVPPIALQWAKYNNLSNYNCSSIKEIISAGAPLPEDIINILKKRLGESNINIRNLFGLTEASPCSASFNNKKGSIGYLTANMEGKITHLENGSNLNSNEIGEICIKGPNVMKGYYNNEKATKEAFDNEGFFLTGDIGYFNDDGELFFIDRKKEIIKCYSNQVSPSELESILISHPKIKDVCVIGVPSIESGESPRAFIVLKDNEKLSKNEIHKWLNPKISFYKSITGGIFFIDQIPKSQSGKILRKQLKDYNVLNLNSKL